MSVDSDPRLQAFSSLLDHLPGMVYRCRNDHDWTMVYVSPGCRELTGYTPEDLCAGGRVSFARIIHPDDRNHVWDQVQAAMEESRAYQLEYRIITAAGEERWVVEHGCALPTGAPVRHLVGFIGSVVSPGSQRQIRLRRGEARFRRFYESVYAGVVVRDAEGDIVYANRAAAEMVGSTPPEGRREPWGDTSPEAIWDDGARVPPAESPSAAALRSGLPVRGAVLGIPAGEGERRWLLVNAEPALDPITGRVREVITTFLDITERRRAMDDLRFRLAFESLISRISSEMVQLEAIEVDSGILRTLQSIGEFVGVGRAYVFQLREDGRTLDNTHEWCAPGVSSQIHRLQSVDFKQQLPWFSKQLFQLQNVHVPRVSELPEEAAAERAEFVSQGIQSLLTVPMIRQSQLVGFLGFDAVRAEKSWSTDAITLLQLVGEIITGALERQRAEQVLRQSEDRFRSLFQNLSDVVMVVDADGRLRFETPSIQRLLGLDPDSLEEARLEDLIASEDLPLLTQLLEGLLEAGGEARRELRCRRHDGGLVDCEVLASNRLDRPGIGGIVLTLRDISERRRAEEEHQRLQQQLQQSQRLESLGILAGGVAHDFNNLLTGVLGEAGVAMAALPADSPARQSVGRMEQAAQRAAELTQQLLAYSGKRQLSKERVRLNALVEETGTLLQVSVARTARLQYRLAEELPRVEGDAAQLRQVVMNLILNAAEACTAEAGGLIEVTTGSGPLSRAELNASWLGEPLATGEFVWLEVKDNGRGISPEVMPRIFDPFFTTKFTGRGLGLAAVLGIVRGHGGAIKVESQAGTGTCFRVLLPVCARADRPEPASPGPAVVPEPSRPSLLIVDDDRTVRLLAESVLRRAGYPVLLATGGQAGLQLLRQHPEIGLVVLDLTMPGMSGKEVLGELRGLRPELPVVVSSGYHEQEVSGEGELQASEFLQKPYTAERLLRAVARALRSPR